MSGTDEVANKFYPTMVKAPEAAPAPVDKAPTTPEGEMAARIYAKPPKEVAWFNEPRSGPQEPTPPAPEELTAAQKIYGDAVSTNSNVDWAEDAAAATTAYDLNPVPGDMRNPDVQAYEAGQAQFREGLLAAGAGPSLARELWNDAVKAENNPIRTTAAEASKQLRDRWGPQADAKFAAARTLLGKAIAKCPEIKEALERTGLGNDVNFIVKLS